MVSRLPEHGCLEPERELLPGRSLTVQLQLTVATALTNTCDTRITLTLPHINAKSNHVVGHALNFRYLYLCCSVVPLSSGIYHLSILLIT